MFKCTEASCITSRPHKDDDIQKEHFDLGTFSEKKRENVGILKKNRGGGLPKSQFFYNLTKCFLACQIHSKVLKHVLQ